MQILLTVIGAYVGICGLLWAFQERLIFHPRAVAVTPWNPAAEPIEIDRGDAVLRGWVVNAESAGPVIVYFGGNAEEVSGNVDNWADRKATTVLVNYRSYGDSTGSPSERALRGDGIAISEWARTEFPDRPLVLVGLSLGSGIAALTAQHVEPDGLILISPYRSVEHIARRSLPFVPVGLLLRHRFSAENAAPDLPRTLVIASQRDHIIPIAENMAMVETIEATAKHRVEVRTFEVSHFGFLRHRGVWRAVDEFLATVSTSPRGDNDD